MDPHTLIDFWFSDEARPHWWRRSDAFDALLRERFGEAHAAASRGELEAWAETAEGSLALVILLDQLSRNLCRDDGAAYDNDERALAVARSAVARGQQEQLPVERRALLYMPFMHAEDAAAQEEGVALFQTIDQPHVVWHARLHQMVVERFGRFPHRDVVLGRPGTTKEEWDAIEGIGMTFGVERPASAR